MNFVLTRMSWVSLLHPLNVHLRLILIQAADEIKVLKNVQALIEDSYVDGRPRHHLPAARNPAPTTESIFFVATSEYYDQLSDQAIQDIFRTRHIVVTDIPTCQYEWTLETLARLGSLQQQREIQGKLLRSPQQLQH